MGLGIDHHHHKNFSDAEIFNHEETALFATIKAAYEDSENDFINVLNYFKDRYELSVLQCELFITSNILGSVQMQNADEKSNFFSGSNPKIKINNDTGLKIGITSLENEGELTVFVGISGYQYTQTVDAKTVLITEGKGVLQGQVIQAVSIINQFNQQINKNRHKDIKWIFGGHSLGGNIIQSVAAILSLDHKAFLNQYSIINSPEFKKKEKITASKVYTFNTLQPKVFLETEFSFLKNKTVNYIIDNDWLLKVLKSTGGSYIGNIKLYKKLKNKDGNYYYELSGDTEDIPINVREKCISKGDVRYLKFTDITRKFSINTIRKYLLQRIKSPITYYKYYRYSKYILKELNNEDKEHGVYNFIADNYEKGNRLPILSK